MRIVACLAWYDEPLEHLHRAVTSLRGLADTLIAVDGAWNLYPDGQSCSAPEQREAIHCAAEEVGILAVVWQGREWTSQVEKRNFLMREGARCGEWMLVIDGDEEIVRSPDTSDVRTILADTGRDVATVVCRHHNDVVNQAPIRRVYRASAGITVETAHNGYRTMDGRWLHGAPSHVTLEPTVALPVTLIHHATSRGEPRNRSAADYRAARRRVQAESWIAA